MDEAGARRWSPIAVDAATALAVKQALRAGGCDDPRIDALARVAAARSRRRPWRLWAYAILAPLSVVSAFELTARGAERAVLIGAHLIVAVLFGVSAGQLAGARRRAHRYLREATS